MLVLLSPVADPLPDESASDDGETLSGVAVTPELEEFGASAAEGNAVPEPNPVFA